MPIAKIEMLEGRTIKQKEALHLIGIAVIWQIEDDEWA